MSDSPKRGLFGRLFGKSRAPEDKDPEKTDPEKQETPRKPETPAPETASDQYDAPVVAPTEGGEDRAKSVRADVVVPPAAPGDVETVDPAKLEPAEPEPASLDVSEARDSIPEPEPEKKRGWFARLTGGLKKTSDQLTGNIAAVFTKRKLDDATLEELEDVLIQADLGVETAMAITEALAKDRYDKDISEEDIRTVLAAEVEAALTPVAQPLTIDTGHAPHVILMVGVNGSGKTTTIGKLASKYKAEGKSVMLAAGDTFRAAAVEQLQIWGERSDVPVVAKETGADAAGLAFDAVTEAKQNGTDVLIIDTAGRLQNRAELMGELEKVVRVIKKVMPEAPHSVLLTLDATTGQNALNQVEIFGKTAGVTGLVMTKLDGTARGGILVAIAKRFGLPVHFIGVGEGIDDLEPFAARDFAIAIAGDATT